MKKLSLLLNVVLAELLISCNGQSKQTGEVAFSIDENIAFADNQYGLMLAMLEDSGETLNPKSFINGNMRFIPPQEWTSGFFPRSLWYLYELTGDEK